MIALAGYGSLGPNKLSGAELPSNKRGSKSSLSKDCENEMKQRVWCQFPLCLHLNTDLYTDGRRFNKRMAWSPKLDRAQLSPVSLPHLNTSYFLLTITLTCRKKGKREPRLQGRDQKGYRGYEKRVETYLGLPRRKRCFGGNAPLGPAAPCYLLPHPSVIGTTESI